MEPPGFEIAGSFPPPPAPPSGASSFQIELLNPTEPPGFENVKQACLQKVGTWDPPPSPNESHWPLGTGSRTHGSEETASIREEMVQQPFSTMGPHGSETGVGPSETKTLESLTVDPWVKTETLYPGMLVPPVPEETLIADGFVEAQIEEQTITHVPKPETLVLLAPEPDPEPEPEFQSPVPDEYLGLPPSPPPLPLPSESIISESICENSNPPALIVPGMLNSTVLKSEYGNLEQYTCETSPIGDNIASENDTVAPLERQSAAQETEMLPPPPPPPPPLMALPLSPPPQFKCESLVPSVPNQEMEVVSCSHGDCSHGDGIPDVLSVETVPPVNQMKEEPPLKSQIMHETQDQLTPEACQPEGWKDPLVSGIPVKGPHGGTNMEAVQIDMDMSDDETLDRSPTEMVPPESDTGDFETLEEAPPGYDTIYPISQTEIVAEDTLPGMGQMVCGNCHELISYPAGAAHVLCTCCQTVNLVLEACQVGNITCGQCLMLLMYPFGVPSVRCSTCRYVTEIGPHNMRPPLSVQQGEGYPFVELQLTETNSCRQ